MVIGYVYKIFDNTNSDVYYGSTKDTISRRMASHRSKYKYWCGGDKRVSCKSFVILANGDYNYSLVEQVDYENKIELYQRERWWIENNVCINKYIPSRSKKEYGKEYRETNKDKNKEYREINKEKKKAYDKEYDRTNRDKINARKRALRAEKKAEKELTV